MPEPTDARPRTEAEWRLLVDRMEARHRDAMERLATSERRYREVVEAQPDFVLRQKPSGHITFVNEAYCKWVSRPRELLLSPSWNELEVLAPESRRVMEEHFARFTPESPVHVVELEGWDHDGRLRYSVWTDTGFFDQDGRLVEVQAVGRDITDRVQAERAREEAVRRLEESERRYREVVEVQTEFVIRQTPDGRHTLVNEAYCQWVGIPREELLAPTWIGFSSLTEASRMAIREHFARFTPEAPVHRIDLEGTDRNGRRIWSSWTDRGIFDEAGQLLEVQAVGRDITDRVEAERAREEAERLRKMALEAALDGYISIDADGVILEFNAAAERIFGFPREAVLGRPMHEVIVPNHARDGHLGGFRTHLETGRSRMMGRPIEVTALHAAGHEFPIEIVIQRSEREGGPVFIAYLRDLTEQKRTEARLAETAARLETVLDGLPLPIVISVLGKAEVVYGNALAREVLGFHLGVPAEVILGSWADPADRARLHDEVSRTGAVDAFEARLRARTGEIFDALISARLITYEGQPVVFSAITDISDKLRAEAEIARQRENLHQSEKLSALGTLLAGVAHELNNPLSVVVGYAAMLREFVTDPAILKRAEKIHEAAERCSRIVRTFLAMARKSPPSPGPVNLSEAIRAALDLSAYGLRSAGVEVLVDLEPGLPPAHGDADQLPQVVTNLLVNAQQALVQVQGPRRIEITARRAGEQIELEVADNGPGMAPEIAARVFEPFYTTKPAGVGTGVGLSVCQGIIEAHGGSISVATAPGQGARFAVRLPLAAAPASPASLRHDPTAPAKPARLLILDDEPEIAALVAEMLIRDGHRAEVAVTAEAALQALQGGEIDLLVSDIRMPGLDGPGLWRAIAATRPVLADRILFLTGDTLSPEVDRFIAETGVPVVEKPIDGEALRAAALARLAAGGFR